VQGFDAPLLHLVHVDVEGGFVELDHVDAVGGQGARLGVEQVGEGERHLHAVAVMGVGDGVDDGHRPGQGDLELAAGMGAGKPRLVCMDAAAQRQRTGYLRHHRLVALLADAHLDPLGEIDAVHEVEEAVDEMLSRLFAIGDDVDAGILLQLDGDEGRIALAGLEVFARKSPRRPQLVGLGEPGRLRQAAGDAGLEHLFPFQRRVCSGPLHR